MVLIPGSYSNVEKIRGHAMKFKFYFFVSGWFLKEVYYCSYVVRKSVWHQCRENFRKKLEARK